MSDSTVWSIIITVLVILWLLYQVAKTGRKDDKFRAHGIKTEAKIVDKQGFGASGTGNMKLKLKVEFETESGIIRTQAKRFFTPEELIKIMRNNTVSLYYLPEDPRRVYLVPQDMD